MLVNGFYFIVVALGIGDFSTATVFETVPTWEACVVKSKQPLPLPDMGDTVGMVVCAEIKDGKTVKRETGPAKFITVIPLPPELFKNLPNPAPEKPKNDIQEQSQ